MIISHLILMNLCNYYKTVQMGDAVVMTNFCSCKMGNLKRNNFKVFLTLVVSPALFRCMSDELFQRTSELKNPSGFSVYLKLSWSAVHVYLEALSGAAVTNSPPSSLHST